MRLSPGGRAALLTGLLGVAWACSGRPDSGDPLWRFEVVDASGAPTAARVTLRDPAGRPVFARWVRRYTSYADTPYFYTEGRFAVETGAAELRVEVSKGFEHPVVRRRVERSATPTRIELARAFDLNARGYYGGDGHVHPEFTGAYRRIGNDELLVMLEAEDLNLANLLAANAFDSRVYLGDRITGRDEPESGPRHILRVSEEYRSDVYGHMSVFDVGDLSDPVFTGFPYSSRPHDYPTNHQAGLRYQEAGAYHSFAHLREQFLLECPIDVALGSLRAVEVLGYSVEPPQAIALWERLLSSGFDVVVTAGTDAILSHPTMSPLGGARSYVDLMDRPFTYETWVEGLALGRSFATNGALVFLSVDGERPGGVVDLAAGEARVARVRVEVDSVFPWEEVVVRHNLRDAAVFRSAADDPRSQRFEASVELDGPGWIYARLRGPLSPGLEANPRGGAEHLAVTNAVRVRRGGEVFLDAASLDYFSGWIEETLRLLERRRNYGSEENRRIVRGLFQRALGVYRERRARAPR